MGTIGGTGAWLPPIAVLPDGSVPQRSPLRRPQSTAVSIAIDPDIAFASSRTVDACLSQVLDVAERAVAALASPSVGDPIEPANELQAYFRIRTSDLGCGETSAHVVRIVADVIEDLRYARLGAHDLRSLLIAIVELGPFRELPDENAAKAGRTPTTAPAPDGPNRWYYRWILAHQFHATLNTFAASAVRSAVQNIDDENSAVEALTSAASFVSAFGASRAHALMHPPTFYTTVLRPSMEPPLSPVALTGRMHREYREYRDAIAKLLQVCPEPIGALSRQRPSLAAAREHLLATDLADAERHVTKVWQVVGQARSLVQGPRSSENAVACLRSIRDRRQSAYRPFVRFLNGAD